MEILGLSTSPGSGGAYALVLSEAEGSRRLPIIIGTFEAQAIALELEHIRPPRPMTHDLLRSVIQSFEGSVKKIIVSELKEGTFYARIIIDTEGLESEIDARPSDAIALGIRFNAPIYVSKSVLDEAGIDAEAQDESDDPMAGVPSGESISSATSTKPKSPEEKLADLQKQLDQAIKNEDYEKAAKIRDQINNLKN